MTTVNQHMVMTTVNQHMVMTTVNQQNGYDYCQPTYGNDNC